MILVQKIVIMKIEIMMMITNMMMIMEQLKVELNKIRACCHLTCTSRYQVQLCLKKAVNRAKLFDLWFIK